MARNRKELPILEGLEISHLAAEGKAITHYDGKVVFVPFAAPGDIVDLKVTKKKSSFLEANIVNIHKASDSRVDAFCSHFTVCGGCKWQHIPYSMQLEAKQQQVVDAMERIGHVKIEEYLPILGSENINRYRNKLEFTFSNKRWLLPGEMPTKDESLNENEEKKASHWPGLGFHIPKMFDKVLNVDKCYLGSEISDEVRLFIRDFTLSKYENYPYFDLRVQEGMMRTLMIRTTSIGEIMVLIVFYENNEKFHKDLLEAVKNKFPQISSLLYCINSKRNDTISDQDIFCYYGKDYIEEDMEGLRFRINAKSFYQTNSKQAYQLYKVAKDFANLSGTEVVYDLYTGCGTIANFVAKDAKKVVGIEYVPEAIEDAKVNSNINNIDNTIFFAGDMKDVLSEDFISEHGRPDVIITDPPRAGMHDSVIDTILKAKADRIVYVSCNPSTQARDLDLLTKTGDYIVKKSRAVDMFPHTHHIENVVLLSRVSK